MRKRNKTAKLTEYGKNNKDSLKEFTNRNVERYVREPWMLKPNAGWEHTIEIEVEDDQGGN